MTRRKEKRIMTGCTGSAFSTTVCEPLTWLFTTLIKTWQWMSEWWQPKQRKYIKNKPTKWGIKLFVLADSNGCTIDFQIYAGKTFLDLVSTFIVISFTQAKHSLGTSLTSALEHVGHTGRAG